jgi:Fe(II)/alpha-ketoglutarate-dependent arginine beta-hydroxylase
MMDRIILTADEISSIQLLLSQLTLQYTSAEDPRFIKDAGVIAHRLPERVRLFLNDFRLLEPPAGICLISGYPIDQDNIGKTPTERKWRSSVSSILEEELLLVLYGSLLGDVFGWETQQDGKLIHDVFPIKSHEDDQIGFSSLQLLWWHSEDAFHPNRADSLGLVCFRNPDRVATTVACISELQLHEDCIRTLSQPRFIIRPDYSHLAINSTLAAAASLTTTEARYQTITKMNDEPEKIAVLYGDSQLPYLRLDPYFMDHLDNDPEAQAALEELIRTIDMNLSDLVLEAGDFCFIDNHRVVHGRRPFQARYDGTDRWLARVNITRDLKKSRSDRSTCSARVLR